MPILTVGNTEIPYAIRYSERARKKRIVVTPEGVEVVAPCGALLDGEDGIAAFVHEKRRWTFDAVREVKAKQGKLLTQHYQSGAKLQYRGRWLMLDVQSSPCEAVQVRCQSKFHVEVPLGLNGTQKLLAVKAGLDGWLRERSERDLQRFIRIHSKRLGVSPRGAKSAEAKHAWGTCGKDEIVRVHWRLIQAPKVAMEYVVVHELCHLIHRNHAKAFWKTVAQTMPDWAEGKAQLERWEREYRAQ